MTGELLEEKCVDILLAISASQTYYSEISTFTNGSGVIIALTENWWQAFYWRWWRGRQSCSLGWAGWPYSRSKSDWMTLQKKHTYNGQRCLHLPTLGNQFIKNILLLTYLTISYTKQNNFLTTNNLLSNNYQTRTNFWPRRFWRVAALLLAEIGWQPWP